MSINISKELISNVIAATNNMDIESFHISGNEIIPANNSFYQKIVNFIKRINTQKNNQDTNQIIFDIAAQTSNKRIALTVAKLTGFDPASQSIIDKSKVREFFENCYVMQMNARSQYLIYEKTPTNLDNFLNVPKFLDISLAVNTIKNSSNSQNISLVQNNHQLQGNADFEKESNPICAVKDNTRSKVDFPGILFMGNLPRRMKANYKKYINENLEFHKIEIKEHQNSEIVFSEGGAQPLVQHSSCSDLASSALPSTEAVLAENGEEIAQSPAPNNIEKKSEGIIDLLNANNPYASVIHCASKEDINAACYYILACKNFTRILPKINLTADLIAEYIKFESENNSASLIFSWRNFLFRLISSVQSINKKSSKKVSFNEAKNLKLFKEIDGLKESEKEEYKKHNKKENKDHKKNLIASKENAHEDYRENPYLRIEDGLGSNEFELFTSKNTKSMRRNIAFSKMVFDAHYGHIVAHDD